MSQAVENNRVFKKNSGSPVWAVISPFHVPPPPPLSWAGFGWGGGGASTCRLSLQPATMAETSENNARVLNRYS